MSKLDEMFTCTELGHGFKPIKKSKEISKDIIPEIGDVFQSNEDKDVRLHITGINNVGLEAIVSNKKEVWNINSWYFDKKYYTYLGKSKANVEQLFEVEDNGRCIEDNTPHAESTILFKDLENEE